MLLNLGCGHRYHNDWINVDFTKTGKNVIAHNLLNGMPFKDNFADGIYHSQLFEHFSKKDAKTFAKECYRVLKLNGTLRIVVPDLENITKEYLSHLEKSLSGDKVAQMNYEWIMLEMYDQVVRNESGGEMLKYLQQKKIPNANYIYERIGIETKSFRYPQNSHLFMPQNNWYMRIPDLFWRIRVRVAKIILGKNAPWMEIGKFRTSGEIHLWMYDRYSLPKLLQECGFRNVGITDAFHSIIPNWEKYNFDVVDGEARGHSSLYIESQK